MRLTFNGNHQLNDEGYCPDGMSVDLADKVHEGFAAKRWDQGFVPVVITEAMDWNDEFIEVEPQTEWFSKVAFKEYEDD